MVVRLKAAGGIFQHHAEISLRKELGTECFGNVFLHVAHAGRRLIALQHTTVATHEKLGEVPLDVGLRGIIGITLQEHVVHHLAFLVVEVEALKTALRLQVGKESRLVGSVHINLVSSCRFYVDAQ